MKGAATPSGAGLRDLLEIVFKDGTAEWFTSLDRVGGNRNLFTPFPVLGIYITSAHSSQSQSHFQGHSSWESSVLLVHLDWLMTEPIKDLIKTLKDSGIWVQRATFLWLLKTSLVWKFSCLLNLPPPNLEWPLSLVSSCPPCMGDSFRFHPGSLQRRLGWWRKL